MSTDIDIDQRTDEFLEHYGVPGMRWGKRKASTGPSSSEVRAAQQKVAAVGGNARKIIKEHRKADSPEAKKAAQERYKNEILGTIKSKEFRETYRTANTVTRGDKIMQIVGLGPLAAVTIPMMKKNAERMGRVGVDMELTVARDVLREMRTL